MAADQDSRVRWILRIIAGAGLIPLIALLAWAAVPPAGDPLDPPVGGLGFMRHFVHYGVWRGWTAGTWDGRWRDVPFLERGDIILCRNPQAVYGRWSHVTIAIDADHVLTQDLLRGMSRGPARDLSWYQECRVIRLGTAAQRDQAAQAAERSIGGMFNLLAHPHDPRQWSCARVVRTAYRSTGIALGDERTWITPDSLLPAVEAAP